MTLYNGLLTELEKYVPSNLALPVDAVQTRQQNYRLMYYNGKLFEWLTRNSEHAKIREYYHAANQKFKNSNAVSDEKKRLVRALKEQGLTHAVIKERTGISKRTISSIVNADTD